MIRTQVIERELARAMRRHQPLTRSAVLPIRTAYHEAGHAVATVVGAGTALDHVTIVPGPGTLGHSQRLPTPEATDRVTAMVSMAGMAAELLVVNRKAFGIIHRRARNSACHDMDMAWTILLLEPEHVLRSLARDVAAVVIHFRRAVEVVAQLLLLRRTMSGAEVQDEVRQLLVTDSLIGPVDACLAHLVKPEFGGSGSPSVAHQEPLHGDRSITAMSVGPEIGKGATSDARKSSDVDLVARAIRAWFRRFGSGACQPCFASSGVEGDYVILRNIDGVLARYRVTGNGLRFAPSEAEETP